MVDFRVKVAPERTPPSPTTGPVSAFLDHHFRHFNAASLIDAARAYGVHLDRGGAMMMTLASAMSTAEIGLSLAAMIRHGKVHAICCTGANLEEDVFNLVAHDAYVRVPHYRDLTPKDEQALLRGLRGIGYISDMIFDKELDYYALLGREHDPALTSNSLIMQLRWCLRGVGICILPEFVAAHHPELTMILPDDIRLTRSFYLVRNQDDARVARINRMAEVVVDWMRAALADRDA
jgi:DNA-binding transcriptional LysR family regulator